MTFRLYVKYSKSQISCSVRFKVQDNSKSLRPNMLNMVVAHRRGLRCITITVTVDIIISVPIYYFAKPLEPNLDKSYLNSVSKSQRPKAMSETHMIFYI